MSDRAKDSGWEETEGKMDQRLISNTMGLRSNFSPAARNHAAFFDPATPLPELDKLGKIGTSMPSARKEELKSVAWIEAQRKDGEKRRIDSYWTVVRSIVGIYHQSDGSGLDSRDSDPLPWKMHLVPTAT